MEPIPEEDRDPGSDLRAVQEEPRGLQAREAQHLQESGIMLLILIFAKGTPS
jgi:hypothetical protein